MKNKIIYFICFLILIFCIGCSNTKKVLSSSTSKPILSSSQLTSSLYEESSSENIVTSEEMPVITEEEYKLGCVKFPKYNDYLREPLKYSESKFVLELTITYIHKDNEIKSLNYFTAEDNNQNEYFFWDNREVLSPELFKNDRIRIYCEPRGSGLGIVEPGVIPVKDIAPELFAKYIYLIN